MEAVSIILLAERVNVRTACLSTAGFLFYLLLYTMGLKRRTPQNISLRVLPGHSRRWSDGPPSLGMWGGVRG